jgi:Holliday junction resolvase RusA-like endonuclease
MVVAVPGKPRGQGSLTLWRGEDGTERAKHPPDTVLHRNFMISALAQAWNGPPLADPVRVEVDLLFARPRSHYGTGRNAGVMKDGAPGWVTGFPDGDKGLRLVFDALTYAGVVTDDRIIVDARVRKMWNDVPRTMVRVGLA